jgi:hypothetical protein
MRERWIIQIPDEAVFVFETIAKSGMCPATLAVISLILETCAVDVVNRVGWEIVHPIRVAVQIHIVVAIVIFEAGEAMLPARRRGDRQLDAT